MLLAPAVGDTPAMKVHLHMHVQRDSLCASGCLYAYALPSVDHTPTWIYVYSAGEHCLWTCVDHVCTDTNVKKIISHIVDIIIYMCSVFIYGALSFDSRVCFELAEYICSLLQPFGLLTDQYWLPTHLTHHSHSNQLFDWQTSCNYLSLLPCAESLQDTNQDLVLRPWPYQQCLCHAKLACDQKFRRPQEKQKLKQLQQSRGVPAQRAP